jgi:hypothetical protein
MCTPARADASERRSTVACGVLQAGVEWTTAEAITIRIRKE